MNGQGVVIDTRKETMAIETKKFVDEFMASDAYKEIQKLRPFKYKVAKVYYNIRAWFDRNYNLLCHKDKCVKITFGKYGEKYYEYNNIITATSNNLRSLGNGFFKIK